MKSNRLANWLLVGASLLIAFVICEAAVRLLPLGDKLGWSMVPPVTERIAAAGAKPEGKHRVVVVGDSFTEWRDNTGQSFVRVAERYLNRKGKQVEMLNLGEAGTGIAQYFGNVLRYSKHLQPDLVIVGLYLGNDLVAANPPLNTIAGRKAAMARRSPEAQTSWVARLAKTSQAINYFYRVLKIHVPQLRSGFFEGIVNHLKKAQKRDAAFVKRRLAAADPQLVDAARADAINGWNLAGAMFFPDYYGDLAASNHGTQTGRQVAGALRDLISLVRYCRQHETEVVILLLPPPVWVAPRYREYFERLGYRNLGPVRKPVPLIEQVKSVLASHGVPTVDILPSLRSSEGNDFLKNDEHLNARGHAIVGNFLAEFLLNPSLDSRDKLLE